MMQEPSEKEFRSVLPTWRKRWREDPGSIEETPKGEGEDPQAAYLDFPPPGEWVYLNGIDARCGEYLAPPLSWDEIHAARFGTPPPKDKTILDWIRRWVERIHRLTKLEPRRAPVPWVNHQRLDEAGWAVVIPQHADPKIEHKLRRLLDHREDEAGKRYKIWSGPDGYRPGESTFQFLRRVGVGLGPPDAETLPYFILLVGSPAEIPYQLQFELDVQYAVGRLHFDDIEDYARYAQNIVRAEQQRCPLEPGIDFFAARNPRDVATQLMQAELILPLIQRLEKIPEAWEIHRYLGDQASKQQLASLLAGSSNSACTFLGGHGLAYPRSHPLQQSQQGALLCQDWPGLGHPPEVGQCFHAGDLSRDMELLGRVFFQFSCFGAGTPNYDHFRQQNRHGTDFSAEEPFLAKLPQELLANGATAFIGHVDRAWETSFSFLGESSELITYEAVLRSLMMGYTTGYAMEWLNSRHSQLSTMLNAEIDPNRNTQLVARDENALWLANNDARNFVLLGDPATRLLGGHLKRAGYHQTVPLSGSPDLEP